MEIQSCVPNKFWRQDMGCVTVDHDRVTCDTVLMRNLLNFNFHLHLHLSNTDFSSYSLALDYL